MRRKVPAPPVGTIASLSSGEFPDLQAAKDHATKLARTAIIELTAKGQPLGNLHVDVTDAKGKVLASVRLRDLMI